MISEKLAPFVRDGELAEEWAASRKTMPEGQPPFLLPESVANNARLAGFDTDAIQFLQKAAGLIVADPDLACLAWHCHRLLFINRSRTPADCRDWPLLADLLGEYGGAFYLIIILSGIPQVHNYHQSLSIPEDIMRDTYRDTLIWAMQYRDIGVFADGRFFHPARPGAWGLDTRILPWLLSHLYGDLYRMGRLQYKTGPYRQRLRAYRNRKSGAVRLLAETGLRFRGDGHFDGTAGIEDPDNAWTSELKEEPDRVTGAAIHPSGRAHRRPLTLFLDTWEQTLVHGDPILELHIPEDGPMDFDACGDSLHLVLEFFPRTFPDRPFKAICCTSWFLDPVYQDLLSSRSNIVRFQRECYLFPHLSRGGRSGLDRIFGKYVHNLSTAPPDSSMRRGVLDHLNSGGALIGGGCLIFPDTLDWGSKVYLRQAAVEP